MLWDDRIRAFQTAWDAWPDLPANFRIDKALKAAGFRDVIKENVDLRVEIDQLKSVADAADRYLAGTTTLAFRPESDPAAEATKKAHRDLIEALKAV